VCSGTRSGRWSNEPRVATRASATNFTASGTIAGEAVTSVTLTPDAAGISATTAAGLGYLASRVLIKRTTPVERIMRSVAEELSHSLGGLIAGAAGSGLIKVTLMSIATKTAAGWIRNATSTDAAGIGATAQPQTGRDSSIVPRADTQTGIETRN